MMFAYSGIVSQSLSNSSFNISDIPANVIFNSSNVILATDRVSTWTNTGTSSINSSGPLQNRPYYTLNSLNGYPSVDFVSAQSIRLSQVSNNLSPNGQRYSQYTICCVFKPVARATETMLFGTGSLATAVQGHYISITPSGSLKTVIKSTITTGSAPNQSFSCETPTSFSNQWVILIWTGYCINANNNITGYVRINGGDNLYNQNTNPSTTRPYNWASPSASITWTMGGGGTNEWFEGSVVEFRYIPRVLTLDTIKMIEGYYATTYGLRNNLPVNHPYKNSSPTVLGNPNYYFDNIQTENRSS